MQAMLVLACNLNLRKDILQSIFTSDTQNKLLALCYKMAHVITFGGCEENIEQRYVYQKMFNLFFYFSCNGEAIFQQNNVRPLDTHRIR